MEIERKFLFGELPGDSSSYPCTIIEQGYLSVEPVVRVRRDGSDYYLTYKGGGMMIREEYNLPLTAESYSHLLSKADGRIITKLRYRIPLDGGLTAEADVFLGGLNGLRMVEVEFPDENTARAFDAPEWFGKEVTFDGRYHNSYLSRAAVLSGLW